MIIVDDGSKDRTLELARVYEQKDPRVKVYSNLKNLGDYPNRNQAAQYAKGKYITYVDSDDKLFPHCLSKMVEATKIYPDAAMFMMTRDQDDPISEPIYYKPLDSYKTHFEKFGFLETGPLGTMILTEAFRSVGCFSGKRMIGDTELFLKLAAIYPLVKLEKKLAYWRKHENQETSVGEKFYLVDIVRMYKEILFCTSNPIRSKKWAYLISVARPRVWLALKLSVKHLDIKRAGYALVILGIVIKK